jgi:predicted nucleic acid-binding protein
MKFLLDTNVVSELRRASKCEPRVLAWQEAQSPGNCYLSVISLMEVRLGIELVVRRDPLAGKSLSTWYERRVKPSFAGRLLPVTSEVAEACALLHAIRPRPFRDALIAATAQVHGLAVATRNVSDFQDTGVPVVNPWA